MTVFLIRIGFNADPDPAFYLNADPDPDPGNQSNADPNQFLVRLCLYKKFDFDMKNILYVSNMSQNIPYRRTVGTKAILKGWKLVFCYLGQFSLLLDPDPHSQYGSGSRRTKSMRIRIGNTCYTSIAIFTWIASLLSE